MTFKSRRIACSRIMGIFSIKERETDDGWFTTNRRCELRYDVTGYSFKESLELMKRDAEIILEEIRDSENHQHEEAQRQVP